MFKNNESKSTFLNTNISLVKFPGKDHWVEKQILQDFGLAGKDL